jgi:hypothetical protein
MDALLARAQTIEDASFRKVQKNILRFHDTRPSGKQLDVGKSSDSNVLIELLFYTPPSNDFMINRIVSAMTKQKMFKKNGESYDVGFAHVEISFPYDRDTLLANKDTNLSFSISQNTTAGFRERTYWREGYTALAISLSSCAYRRLFDVCADISRKNIGFDKVGMYLAPYASRSFLEKRTDEIHGTFCSKLIVNALQRAEIAPDATTSLFACESTPTSLYFALSAHFIPTQRFDTRQNLAGTHKRPV